MSDNSLFQRLESDQDYKVAVDEASGMTQMETGSLAHFSFIW